MPAAFLNMPRRPYTRYTPAQKQLVRELYHTHSNAELAHLLGIATPRKIEVV